MAKPSKRRWAVEKRERRVLAQREKAQRVADRLLGKRTPGNIGIDHAVGQDYSWSILHRNCATGTTTAPKP